MKNTMTTSTPAAPADKARTGVTNSQPAISSPLVIDVWLMLGLKTRVHRPAVAVGDEEKLGIQRSSPSRLNGVALTAQIGTCCARKRRTSEMLRSAGPYAQPVRRMRHRC